MAVVAALASAGGLAFAVGDRGTAAPVAPHFVDDTAASGIDHRYDGGSQFFEGGGVAVFDCDDDGRPDLYFAGGTASRRPLPQRSPSAARCVSPVSHSATTDLTEVTGAYPIDIDSDGHIDLVVLRVGGDVVLRGLGNCRVRTGQQHAGASTAEHAGPTRSARLGGTNALPTLAFGDYLAPDGQSCENSRLFRPAPGGPGTPPRIALAPGYCTLSVLFSDWQHTGRRDLRMSNDRNYYRDGSEQLWRIAPGTPPVPYTAADGWRPLQIWGMGIASQDITGDGVPEVFLTSQGDNKLQTLVRRESNRRTRTSRSAPASPPPALHGRRHPPSTAWHAEFQDVNNDGFADLFVTKGNVDAQPDYASRIRATCCSARRTGSSSSRPTAGSWITGRPVAPPSSTSTSTACSTSSSSTGATTSRCGATPGEETPSVEAMGDWIDVRPRQPAPNVERSGAGSTSGSAIGRDTRELTIGGGHASGQLGWVHVGLGKDRRPRSGSSGPTARSARGKRCRPERAFDRRPEGHIRGPVAGLWGRGQCAVRAERLRSCGRIPRRRRCARSDAVRAVDVGCGRCSRARLHLVLPHPAPSGRRCPPARRR